MPNYLERKTFKGSLKTKLHSFDVSFDATIDDRGHLKVELQRFPIALEIKPLMNLDADNCADEIVELAGLSNSGETFRSNSIYTVGFSHGTDPNSGSYFELKLSCAEAKIFVKNENPMPLFLRYRLKGFETFHTLTAPSNLGLVSIGGPANAPKIDELSGWLRFHRQDR